MVYLESENKPYIIMYVYKVYITVRVIIRLAQIMAYIATLALKGGICHSVEWQIPPFKAKVP